MQKSIGLRSDKRKLSASADADASVLAVALDKGDRHAGGDVSHAATGHNAIEWLKVSQFDLVAIACEVPDISVEELVGTIKQCWPWQRWALITPDASDDDIRRAAEQGAVGVFDRIPKFVRKANTTSKSRLRYAWSEPKSAEKPALCEVGRTTRR